MSNYNLKLITLSMLVGYFAVLLTLSLIGRLYKSQDAHKEPLLVFSMLIVGTSLWSIHFLDVLAFPLLQSTGYTISYIMLSWISALTVALSVLYMSCKKTLPLKSLLIASFVAGMSACAMFYFSIYSMKIQPTVTFSPLISVICLMVSVAVAMLGIMVMFWLKSYSGKFPFLTKSIFAVLMSLAITGVHLIYNTAIEIPHNAISNTVVHFDNTLLGLTVALGFVCLFFATCIVAIFYEKFSYDTFKFSLAPKIDHQQLNNLAMLDALTQLPNRRAFQQHLESAIKRSSRGNATIAVAFIDLDNFKPINDTHGHHVGDEVLSIIAKRLNAAVRGCDFVARIGGDEFVAIIEEIKSENDIVPIAERIVNSVREILVINDNQITISASVGIAVYPTDGGDIDKLLICADAAMYRAKSDGKNQFRFFDAEIELASDQMLELQRDLRHAIDNNEFRLRFQPKVDTRSQAPVGAEALIRWQHPSKGLLMPSMFMPAAEKFGLLEQINTWVIEEACRTIRRLQGYDVHLNISINLSSQQFRNPNLVDEIKRLLDRFNLPHNSLTFEITEAAAVKNQKLFDTLLTKFSEAGINTAIDDFGTHPSNLAYLQSLKVYELKLDKEFIVDIGTSAQSRAVADAVIRLAHALDFIVVAEGVETEEQRLILTEMNCDQMQGYLFSRPISEGKLIALIKQLDTSFKSTGQFMVTDYQQP